MRVAEWRFSSSETHFSWTSLNLKISATFWVSPPLRFYPGEGWNSTRRDRRGWAQASKVSAQNGSPAESSTHLECLIGRNLQRNQKLTWSAPTGTTRGESLSAEQTACLSRLKHYNSNIIALNSDLKNSRSVSSIHPFTFALRTAGTSLTTVASDVKKRRVWIYCAQSSLSSFRDEDLRLSSFLPSQ